MRLSTSTTQVRILALAFAVLVVAGSGLILLTATAAGQETTVTNGTDTQPPGGERVHDDLLLTDKQYSNGTLSLTFQADGSTAVTLVDAGAFMDGGTLPTRTAVIDGETTMDMPVTEVDGMVGVTVISGGTRYAVPVRTSSDTDLFHGEPTWQDTRIAGMSGFAGGLLVVSAAAVYRKRSDEGEVERVL